MRAARCLRPTWASSRRGVFIHRDRMRRRALLWLASKVGSTFPNSRGLERKTLRGLRDAQPPAADEDVHMRERLAEGEDELVRVLNPAPENDRHEFGDRLGSLLAGFENGHAARLVVGDEL